VKFFNEKTCLSYHESRGNSICGEQVTFKKIYHHIKSWSKIGHPLPIVNFVRGNFWRIW
jgi:hypothetical protein